MMGKDTRAAAVAQRDANSQSSSCFSVGSEQRNGAEGMRRMQEGVLEGSSL